MKTFNANTLAILESGRAVSRIAMRLFLPSATYSFWTGQGILTVDGVDYIGAGQLIQLDSIGSVSDLSAVPLTATLSSVPNTDLTPDVLATIEAEQWHQKIVQISRIYIDPDTRAVLSVEGIYQGFLDKIDHVDQIGGGCTLRFYIESKARDYLKTGYRTRSDADQRKIKSDDGGLAYCATAGQQTIYWGTTNTNPNALGSTSTG